MEIKLISNTDSKFGQIILDDFYKNKLIPAEKKSYITNLKKSIGPYLGIQSENGETHYILDAASQIATLGFGFNPSLFFGSSTHLESWTNDPTVKNFKNMRIAFQNFFNRKLNWKKTYLTFVNSGAEANETALGYCYRTRTHKEANKVLAFEGSFHGRMMITLAATWNKSKREPFEWKDYLAEYVKYPELPDSNIHQPFPKEWKKIWNEASLKEFQIPSEWKNDEILKNEIETLICVREKLLSKKIFAILIEPMQCEGGDCYSSDRFHTALLLMAHTFKVPVIHDEVQTGFHLGREFFWHRQFNLTDVNGNQLNPDYVVCAKKAQIGIVLSHKETKNIFKGEEFSVASTYRGYAHAISLDQNQQRILDLEKKLIPRLNKFLENNNSFLHRPRTNGLAFAFDIKDPTLLNKFVDLRFKFGLLYYPAGSQTLRFRLNLAFKENDLDILFQRLQFICNELFLGLKQEIDTTVQTDHANPTETYDWHQFLLELKTNKLLNQKDEIIKSEERIIKLLSLQPGFNLVEINSTNFFAYSEKIKSLQQEVYEPARQTDILKFEAAIAHKNSICLAITDNSNNLIAISFAAPLNLFPLERGLRTDPYFDDNSVLYMLDVTVTSKMQTSGLGKNLKYATTAKSIIKAIKKLQGRNRDRLAAQMLNINLSLGAYEQSYFREDYPDFENYRDVFYYTIPTEWKKTHPLLSRAINTPMSFTSLNSDYFNKQLPFIVNKVCLSNFVSHCFLENIKKISEQLPVDLRHIYTCSSQSECVDKVVKTIWVKSDIRQKEKNVNKLLTFKGHFFGNGSAMARSLSYDDDQYFNVKKLSNPNEKNYLDILKEVESQLKNENYLAVWIEPLLQKSMDKVPYLFLKGLREITKKYSVALVYNESASQFYRYSHKGFFASNFSEIQPDAGIVFLSGQAGIAYTNENYFLEQPLMLISTWDGDEFSFNTYFEVFNKITLDPLKYKETTKLFHQKLIDNLGAYELDSLSIENGIGYFKGTIPASIQKFFVYSNGHYLVCPSYDDMLEYISL